LKAEKITLFQFFVLFILLVYASPVYLIGGAKSFAYLTPALTAPAALLLFLMFNFILTKFPGPLTGAFDRLLGKVTGRAVLVFYLLWLTIIPACYLDEFNANITNNMSPNMDGFLFLAIMSALISYALHGRFTTVVYTGLFIALAGFIAFILNNFLSIPLIDFVNFRPAEVFDPASLLEAGYKSGGRMLFGFSIFFLYDFVRDRSKYIKAAAVCSVSYFLLSTVNIFVMLGVFGENLMASLDPYYPACREISVFGIDKTEILSFFLIPAIYFMIIASLIFIAAKIAREIKILPNSVFLTDVILLLALGVFLLLPGERTKISEVMNSVSLPLNIIFCAVIPVILFIIALIKKPAPAE